MAIAANLANGLMRATESGQPLVVVDGAYPLQYGLYVSTGLSG